MSVGRHPDVNGNLTLAVPGWSSGGTSFRDPQRHFDYGGLYSPPGTPPLLGGTEPDAGELSTLVTLPSVGMDVEIAFYYNSHSRETTWAGYKRTCNLFLSAKACGTPISGGSLDGLLPYVTLRRGNGARSTYRLTDDGTFVATSNCGRNRLFYDSENKLWMEETPDGRQTAYAAKWNGESSPVLTVKDAVGNRHTFHYDGQGRLVALEDAVGRFVRFNYDKAGKCDVLHGIMDWAGRITTFEYDGKTRPCKPTLRFVRTAIAGTNRIAQTEYGYDPKGRLTGIIDAEGFKTIYDLQRNGKVHGRRIFNLDGSNVTTLYRYGTEEVEGQLLCATQAQDPTGALTTSFQTAQLKVAKVRTRLGQRLRFDYDARGHETARHDPAQKVWQIFYGEDGFPVATKDGENRQTTLEYDQYHNLRFIHEMWPGGGTTEMVWANSDFDEDGHRRSLQKQIDETGRETQFLYNSRGQLTAAGDAVSRVFYELDEVTGFEMATHRPVTDVENGATILTTHSQRDAVGNLLELMDEEGKVWKYRYDQGDRVVKSFTPGHPDANAARFSYDLLGNLRRATNEMQEVSTYDDFNVFDQVGTIQDATRNGATRSHYDGIGRLFEQQDPEGHVSRVHYDQQNGGGFPVASHRTLNGSFRTKTYSDLGYGVCFEDGRGFLSNTIFDLAGHARVVVDERAAETFINPDAIGRPITVINALQQRTVAQYDQADQEGNSQTTVLDALNRITRSVSDKAGRDLYFVNEFGHRTTNIHDQVGRLTGILDAKSGTTQTHLDELDRMVGVTDARQHALGDQGRRTHFAFNGRGLTRKITDQLGHATGMNYNDAGDLLHHDAPIPGGGTRRTTFTSDPLGRTTGVDYGNRVGQTPLGFEFDALGRLNKVHDATGPTSHGYDKNDLLTSVEAPGAGKLVHQLDAEGNRTQLSGPNQGDATSYSYDEAGNLLSITVNGQVTSFGFDALGRENFKTLPNGIMVRRNWDEVGRPKMLSYTRIEQVQASDSPAPMAVEKLVASYHIEYGEYQDATTNQRCLRQVVTELQDIGPKSEVTFDFDPLFQLVREERTGYGPNYSIVYDYDAAGNRIFRYEDGATTTYDYDSANRLTRQSTTSGISGQSITSYDYDLQGNCTQITKNGILTSLSWDEDGHLTRFELPNGQNARYVYGADGLRRSVDTGAGPKQQVWNDDNLLLDGMNRYTDAPGEWGSLSAVQGADGTKRVFVFDWQGNTRLLTDESGTVTDRYTYTAFGQLKQKSGTTQNPLRFGGEVGYYSDDDDQIYIRARHYQPSTGRFLSADPIEFEAGINFYVYADNDPVNQGDPSGLDVTIGPFQFNARESAKGLKTGVAATVSAFTFGIYKGGKYRHEVGYQGANNLGVGAREVLITAGTLGVGTGARVTVGGVRAASARVVFRGSSRVEAQALMAQGLSRRRAFGAIRAFNSGKTTVKGREVVFHFTTIKGGKAIVRSKGLIATRRGTSGPGVYGGTTGVPSKLLKHNPLGGWGLPAGRNTRIPIIIKGNLKNATRSGKRFGYFPIKTRIIGKGESVLLRR